MVTFTDIECWRWSNSNDDAGRRPAGRRKMRALEKSGVKLTLFNIASWWTSWLWPMASADAQRTPALLQEGVRSDSDYPLNYYNLACVAADGNDNPAVPKNLSLAFQRRAQVPRANRCRIPRLIPRSRNTLRMLTSNPL